MYLLVPGKDGEAAQALFAWRVIVGTQVRYFDCGICHGVELSDGLVPPSVCVCVCRFIDFSLAHFPSIHLAAAGSITVDICPPPRSLFLRGGGHDAKGRMTTFSIRRAIQTRALHVLYLPLISTRGRMNGEIFVEAYATDGDIARDQDGVSHQPLFFSDLQM